MLHFTSLIIIGELCTGVVLLARFHRGLNIINCRKKFRESDRPGKRDEKIAGKSKDWQMVGQH
jgi:hypothetical protein